LQGVRSYSGLETKRSIVGENYVSYCVFIQLMIAATPQNHSDGTARRAAKSDKDDLQCLRVFGEGVETLAAAR
jgi:hypothetical protein